MTPAELAARERAEQRLPECVTDAVALERLARVLARATVPARRNRRSRTQAAA